MFDVSYGGQRTLEGEGVARARGGLKGDVKRLAGSAYAYSAVIARDAAFSTT